MPDKMPSLSDPSQLQQKAMSRWDNEGGASRQDPQEGAISSECGADDEPQLTNSELVQLQVRLIALENLVIALLAGASDRQIELASEMTRYISPRPGFTHHPLTTRAASHMLDLVERARRARLGLLVYLNKTQLVCLQHMHLMVGRFALLLDLRLRHPMTDHP